MDLVEIKRRQNYSADKIREFEEQLDARFADLMLRKVRNKNDLSIFATGSFGRLEASESSDLDTFVVYLSKEKQKSIALDHQVIFGALVEQNRICGLPDFDRGGEFIKPYRIKDLVKNIGTPKDEKKNTLTARLLVMLESKPLLCNDTHDKLLRAIIEVYWRDFEDYAENFRPTFLLNDILKYWRLLCVDYESKMTDSHPDNHLRKQNRKSKSLKLKYNRMMTCFSAIATLCQEYSSNDTVSPEFALNLCKMTPIDRLHKIRTDENSSPTTKRHIEDLLSSYDNFLQISSENKTQLQSNLAKSAFFNDQRKKANDFGNTFFDLIRGITGEKDLFRYLLV